MNSSCILFVKLFLSVFQPTLATFQAQNLQEYIHEQNRIALMRQGWKPPESVLARKRSASGGSSNVSVVDGYQVMIVYVVFIKSFFFALALCVLL